MTVEYDLVIIGGSAAGIEAAIAAAALKARVALVTDHWLDAELVRRQTLAQTGKVWQLLQQAVEFGINEPTSDRGSIAWDRVSQRSDAIIASLETQQSPALVKAAGVEVIWGKGEFRNRPGLALAVNGRVLRARAYLLAPNSRPVLPDISGLQETGFATGETIWQKKLRELVIVGGDPVGVELAQTFTRLGVRVTMVVNQPRILIKEDAEAAQLIQAQLEAEGVRILTDTQVIQVKHIHDKKWLQTEGKLLPDSSSQCATSEAIAADEILLAAGQEPNLTSLNLAEVGIRWQPQGIPVNSRLQTLNPRIYLCSGATKGYPYAHIACYEARIAVKNALFWPVQADYRDIPWTVFSDPPLVQVGMTIAQAQRQYGQQVWILQQPYKTSVKAKIQATPTGFCKILVRPNGEILGAQVLGVEASELIGAIALAIRQRLNISALANLVMPSPTLSEILSQTAAQWSQRRLNQNHFWQDCLESFFHWRREIG